MEKLSEYNWIDIFDLLSSENIENAANSCENWRNIITTTPSLMRKLTLDINFDNIKGRSWMKLPYQNLYLEQDYDTQRHKIDEFIQDIDQLTAVKKIFIVDLNLVDVIQIVNKFQNLTTLIVKYMSGWDVQDETKIDLPNLTHLKIDTSAFLLLPKIRSHKIEVIYACEERKSLTPDRAKDFGSFLQTCDKLKHLTLKHFYTDQIVKIKSQLETFEIINVYGPLPSTFLQFLKFQKSSLKNLTLKVIELDDEIANYMYFEMNLDKIVDGLSHRGQIQKLKKVSVKYLTIYNLEDNFEYFEKLFQCCEMLEALSVHLPGRKPLEFFRMLSKLPKLKYLKLHGYSIYQERFDPTFKFNRLERLILSENFKTHKSVKIIRCCPNLTHVKISNKNLTKNDFENIFQDCSKIQKIYLLSSNQEFTDEDIETFKDVGSKINLKIETNREIEKLSDAKNQLTVIPVQPQLRDPFLVRPKILSLLFYDYNDYSQQDYFDQGESFY